MTTVELLADVIAALDRLGIPYMIVGSTASSHHAAPRATQDIDLVIAADGPDVVEEFAKLVEQRRYYVNTETARAMNPGTQFNVIDPRTGWRIDLIFRRDRAFSREEFARRQKTDVLGIDAYVATAEDTILTKLEWARAGDSGMQLRDVVGLLRVRSDLDDDYLDRWSEELDVGELLQEARSEARRDR